MSRRFFRLAPLFYFLIILSSIFEPSLSGHSNENPCNDWYQAISNFFMISNLYADGNNNNQCADHAWTIPMLFQLSMLTPCVVCFSVWAR